ncbi:MAG: hypothetical protein U9Q82_14570, partial [Chloroflexota bacterium]|nr:hypothetical protein [Chloroflexota bacterium]
QHAQVRLKSLTAAEKPKKRRFSKWIVIALVAVIGLGLVGAIGWRYGDFLLRFNPFTKTASQVALATGAPGQIDSSTLMPTMTQAVSLTAAHTEVESAVPAAETLIPVTVSPSATATIIPTGTSSPAPTATAVLNEDVAAQMDLIQEQVSELRNLEIIAPVERSIIPENELLPLLESIYLERNTKDVVAEQAMVLSTLGLIEPTYDLYTETLSQIGEGIGGFYVPWTDDLYLIGTTFTGLERYVFAHEYTHALADQHFFLDEIGVYPECLSDTDRCLAISALIEGDATYLMNEWLMTYGSEDDLADIVAAQYAPLDEAISSSHLPPPYLVRELNFKYGDGYDFVEHFIDKWGWQMINIIYTKPPQTTEQIFHPQKYQVKEEPKTVPEPPLQAVLGDDWRLLVSDSLGELGTQMILAYSADRLAHIDPEVAVDAAAGWGGDRYRVFYRGTTHSNILVADWVWDHRREADEFFPAMQQYLDLHYRGKSVDHEAGLCWELLNDHFSCIFQADAETLWIMAPKMDSVDLIRQQYPAFSNIAE